MGAAQRIITPEFRASWANVFKPRENKRDDGTVVFEYDLVGLFAPGTDLSGLKAAAKQCLIDKFGADSSKWPKNARSPVREQEEREKEGKLPDGFVKGGFFITMKSKQRPGLVDARRQPIIDETEFYSGCYARAQVHCYWYDVKGNKGVAFGLDNIQKTRDGDPLSGRQKAEDAFEAVAGAADAGGSDEDPFK